MLYGVILLVSVKCLKSHLILTSSGLNDRLNFTYQANTTNEIIWR